MDIKYSWIPGGIVNREMLEECSSLYSMHYGDWSELSPVSPGERVSLSAERISDWLRNDGASLYQAHTNGELIGYAIAIRLEVRNYSGYISWVTQLVVHEEYRNKAVAKSLLFSIWTFSDHFAWGIITANPYAIRALEKATRRRCHPVRIKRNKKKLFDLGRGNINYIGSSTQLEVTHSKAAINTKFFIDHSSLEEMVRRAAPGSIPWLLGELEEGWEWFAFTFYDQEPLRLTEEEINNMISASDQVTKQAYSRMQLNNQHAWMTHTEVEIEFIVHECELTTTNTILDFGCGIGRHSIGLAKKGFSVTGVDYIPEYVEHAKNEISRLEIGNADFIVADCRQAKLDIQYDIVLCLYDVVGSFVEDKDNRRVLECIASNLKSSGIAIISVMNYELTKSMAKHVFTFAEEPDRLQELEPAQIMEQTGNIFDPEHYMVDSHTHIVYRKEQFTGREGLPVELLVRDKRYSRKEIMQLCEEVGLEVQWANYVRAGRWNDPLEPCHMDAKEILVFCKKK